MIALLTNIVPIVLGFLAKTMALRAEDDARRQELAIAALAAKTNSVELARKYDSPVANASRRMILWFLMFLISITVVGYAIFRVPIMVETIKKGSSLLFGLWQNPDTTEWVAVNGIVSHKEFLEWMSLIIEMYFGSTLARRN